MAQSNSILWREQRLESGSWAHGLSWLLAPKRLIKGWHPKIRAERASKRRYIQYEPVNWSGPFVFAGRPAIKAVPERDSTPERLVVGYLVERGHPIGTTAEDDLLSDSRIRSRLDHLVLMFDGNRRMARIVISGVPETDLAIPYVGGSSLRAIETVVATSDPQEVISVMLGVSFTLEECLRFSQADILNEFSPALAIAADIAEMIENAVQ
jgi:hypothetical protein